MVVGHRGCMAEAPENTMVSFRRALDQGAEMVELDVQLSADGVPVVIHDDTLTRTSGGGSDLAVGRASVSQLQAVDVGALFPDFRGATVPTLEEVLRELCPRIPVNVELKFFNMHCRPLCLGVAQVLQRLEVVQRVLVTSFFHGSLPVIRRFCPGLVTGRLYHDLSTGPLYPDDAAEILQEPLLDTPLPFRGRVVVMEQSMVNRDLVDMVHSGSGKVLVYTVNDESEMRRLLELGVDAIISNTPGRLREVSEAHSSRSSDARSPY